MRVNVLAFASAAEAIGDSETTLELPDGSSVGVRNATAAELEPPPPKPPPSFGGVALAVLIILAVLFGVCLATVLFKLRRRWRRRQAAKRAAAHETWLYGLCLIALRLNRCRFNRNLSKRRVIALARASQQ